MITKPKSVNYPAFHYFLCVLCVLCGEYLASAQEALRTAGDRPIDIQHIRLDLNVDLPKRTVMGMATLQVRALRPLGGVALDAVDFEVKEVRVGAAGKDGTTARFSHDGKRLAIDLPAPWKEGQVETLKIAYRVRDPQAGLHFFGPTPAEPEVPWTVWSQGEPTTNRHWIPCLDQPNQRQSTELVVTVAEGYEALSNGKLAERRDNPDKTATFHWKQEKSHPSYLVTLVVGQFDVIQEDWNRLPVLYYVPKGRKPDVARTFGRTRAMLDFFTKRFGIDYPWEKYAQVVVEQFTSGGMENTSATTLTERTLHDERAFLDSSPDGLIAHELAHQWWGDMLTCRDWAHLWLNEGFATFAEVIWAEHNQGADEGAYLNLTKKRLALAGGKERPVVDRRYPSPGSMFDARSYPKGSWVLHMLRKQLGDEAFWKALRRYGVEHRYQTVDTTDFRKTLERETGRDLERFFHDWTERPGHPVLECAVEYLSESKQAKLSVKQTQAGDAFHVPLHVAFHGGGKTPPVPLDQTLTEKEATFFVTLPDRPSRIEVDPEQAVLADIKETKSRDLWLAQLRQSASVASRARAAEHFGQSKADVDREALAKALADEKFWGVQVEIAHALGKSGGDASREALVGGLKQTHPKVRRACAEQLGKFRRDAKTAAALKGVLKQGDASYFVEAAAVTAYAKLRQPDTSAVVLPYLAKPSYNEVLRSAVLEGLGHAGDLGAVDTLIAWSKRGKPRGPRVAALHALVRLAQTGNPTDKQRQTIVAAITGCLEGETPPIRRAAVTAIRDLGRLAELSLTTLEAIILHDPDDRVRDMAQKAIVQIRAQAPVPTELTRLREELDQLRKAQEEMRLKQQQIEKR